MSFFTISMHSFASLVPHLRGPVGDCTDREKTVGETFLFLFLIFASNKICIATVIFRLLPQQLQNYDNLGPLVNLRHFFFLLTSNFRFFVNYQNRTTKTYANLTSATDRQFIPGISSTAGQGTYTFLNGRTVYLSNISICIYLMFYNKKKKQFMYNKKYILIFNTLNVHNENNANKCTQLSIFD